MKFSASVALIIALSLPLLTVATPVVLENRDSAGACSVGAIQCCNQVMSSSEAKANGLLDLLGPATGLLGIECSPLASSGATASKCDGGPMCCDSKTGNTGPLSFSSGCVPVNVG